MTIAQEHFPGGNDWLARVYHIRPNKKSHPGYEGGNRGNRNAETQKAIKLRQKKRCLEYIISGI